MSGNWYILYTNPGQEKKVSAYLTKKGFENFCPLNPSTSDYSDRKKQSGEPLFQRYVFVYMSASQLLTVRSFPGVLQLVYWLSKPAVVKDEEIKIIREFCSRHRHIELSKSFVDAEEECQVTRVPYLSAEKLSIAPIKSCVKVLLPSLGYTMTAFLEQEELGILPVSQPNLKMVS